MGILKIIMQAGALALPAFGEVGVLGEAGGAPPTGATRLYTPSDSHQLLLLLLCLLLWPTRQVIDLCAYRL